MSISTLSAILTLALGASLAGSIPQELPGDAYTNDAYTYEQPVSQREELLKADYGRGLFVLANKQHALGPDYSPGDLVKCRYTAGNSSGNVYMRQEAAENINRLCEAAADEGLTISVVSAYRSYEYQKNLWNRYVSLDGEALASTYSARPGTSEHQTGLCADVSSPEIGYGVAVNLRYENTAPAQWLGKNAWRYGFIIRYPYGMEGITGYTYEPWHIRYVGTTAAKEIYESGVTLEEYLEQNPFLCP